MLISTGDTTPLSVSCWKAYVGIIFVSVFRFLLSVAFTLNVTLLYFVPREFLGAVEAKRGTAAAFQLFSTGKLVLSLALGALLRTSHGAAPPFSACSGESARARGFAGPAVHGEGPAAP